MSAPTIPVIFIHGLWLHATSWSSWTELFTTAGYDATAPGWPGDSESVELSRKDPESIADHGIDDVVAHYTEIINALDVKPILIGHSFGGMIAEKLLGQDLARAAIAIDAAQIKGCCRCRCRRCARPCPCSRTRPTSTGPSRSPSTSSPTRSATPSRLRKPPNCTNAGPSPRRASRCSRPPPPTSPPLARQGRHGQQHSGTAAPDRRRQGPHGPGDRHQGDPQAVPGLHRDHRLPGLPRPRPLPDHRPRLA